MRIQINPPKKTKISTKFIVTVDKSLKDEMENTVNLKKGDLLQGIAIYTIGDMANDSGRQYLVFTNKEGNKFKIQQGFRGFQPFFQELNSSNGTSISIGQEQTFLQKHKNHLLILGALVIGYYAYKEFNK